MCYSALKSKEGDSGHTLQHGWTVKDIMLSEIRQIQKDKHHTVPHDGWSNSYAEKVKHGCQELKDQGMSGSLCDSWGDGEALKMAGGDGCTTMSVYSLPVNELLHLRMAEMVKLMFWLFYSQWKETINAA